MKIITTNNKALLPYQPNDSIIKKLYKKNITEFYFTNRYNFKITQNFELLKNDLTKNEKFFYLFKYLSTKDYLDYPVYRYYYGNGFVYKEFLTKLINIKENPKAVKIILQNINKIKKRNFKKIIITFDNHHLIRFHNKSSILIFNQQAEKLYQLEGKYLWINLSTHENIRYLDFSKFRFIGDIYDPFMNWKKDFLERYNFRIL